MEKMALAFDKIEKTNEIKTHFQNSIELLEDTNNKRYNNYKFIMQKIIFIVTPSYNNNSKINELTNTITK